MTPSKDNSSIESPFQIAVPENGHGTLAHVAHEQPGADVWDTVWLVWRRRRFVAKVVVWAVVISSVIALTMPKRYDSTIRLMPPDSSGSGLAMLAAMSGRGGFGLGSLASDLLGTGTSGELWVDILRGRTVQDDIVDRFDLRKEYSLKYFVDARKRLAQNTVIAQDRKSGVITIVVSDKDPKRAAKMAQAYVDELDRLVATVSTSAARRERVFIEERLNTVKQGLDQSSQQFSEFASKNSALDISVQGKAMVEAAARLQGELIAAQTEVEGLEQIYTANNVRVRSAQARVNELKQQLDKLAGPVAGASAGNPAAPSDGAPKSASDFPTIRQLPILGVRWADLYRQTKIQETVYELLTQQFELAKIQEAKEIPTVKVLDSADVPERRSSPKRTLIVVVSTIFALLGASVWVVGAAMWQQIDASDTRKLLARDVWMQVQVLPPVAVVRTRWSQWKESKAEKEEKAA